MPRKNAVPGSSVATVSAAARASMPASVTHSRWSADAAPNRAASSAPPRGAAGQLLEVAARCLADAADGGGDAAAAGRDLLIGQPLQAFLELVLPRARKEEVRVAVHQAGQHRLAGRVEDLGAGGQLGHL